MKVTICTYMHSRRQTSEGDLVGIDRRKLKKLKRKGYIIDVVSDLKLFSHRCIRYSNDYVAAEEFWLVPKNRMTMNELASYIRDMLLSRQLYFNKSFKCNTPNGTTSSLRNFLEIDHDCDEYTIGTCTSKRITGVNLFRVFENTRDYTKWKLSQ